MRHPCIKWIVCLFLASLASTGARPLKRVPIAVIVNRSNPMGNIEMAELRRLLLGEVRQWANQRRVTIVHRDQESAAYQTSLDLVTHMTAAEYRRFLLNQEFRGDEPVTLKVLNSASSACEFVFNVPGAIAVVEAEPALTAPCLTLVKVLTVNSKLPGDVDYSLR